MFGLRLIDKIQINIGDSYNDTVKKIDKFLSLSKDEFWAEFRELNDKYLSTRIVIYSKGKIIPHVEVVLILADNIVTHIIIAGSNIYNKFVIKDEELDAKEAYEKYKEKCTAQDSYITLDGRIKITFDKNGKAGLLIGTTEKGSNIYSDVEYKYSGMMLDCYTWDEADELRYAL